MSRRTPEDGRMRGHALAFSKNLGHAALLLCGLALLLPDIAGGPFEVLAQPVPRAAARVGLALGGGLVGLLWIVERRRGARPAGELAARLLLVGASTAVGLLLAEGLVRVVLRDVGTVYDSRFLYTVRWQERIADEVNSAGVREPEIGAKPEGTFRIALVGDGIVYGQGVPRDARLSHLLEREIGRRAAAAGGGAGRGAPRRFEVLGFGRPGDQPRDEIETLEGPVLAASPDFILLQWFVNDPEGSNHAGTPRAPNLIPRFVRTYLLAGLDLRPPLRRHSALFYVASHEWTALLVRFGLVESYVSYMRRRFRDPDGPAWRAADREFRELVQRVRRTGLPHAVVAFPMLFDASSADDYPFGHLIDHVLRTCEEVEVSCLDLRDVFRSVRPASALWVGPHDIHPGEGANRLAAAAIVSAFGDEWGLAERVTTTTRSMAGRPGARSGRAASPGR